jgi:hypothetical protein
MSKHRGRPVPPASIESFPSDAAALDALITLTATAVPLRLIGMNTTEASRPGVPEPVLFMDATERPDVAALFAAHREVEDGEVNVRWKVLAVKGAQRAAVLYFEFAAPRPCTFHVVFPFLRGPEDTTLAVQAMATYREVQLTTDPVPYADADDPGQQHDISTINVSLTSYPARIPGAPAGTANAGNLPPA